MKHSLLYELFQLNLRVQAFSLTKEITEKFILRNKLGKKKYFRKDIKKSRLSNLKDIIYI